MAERSICPQHGPTCANWSPALATHVTVPPAPPTWGTGANEGELLTTDQQAKAQTFGSCVAFLAQCLLAVIATALVTYGAIQLLEIKEELRRANDIECVRFQNEGYDSFGARDRRACPP